MLKKYKIILIGGGGHALNCAQLFLENDYEIFGYIDLKPCKKIENIFNLKYLGNDIIIKKYISKDYFFFVSIGGTKYKLRTNLFNYIKKNGGEFSNCISKDAYVAENTKIGKNIAIFPKAIVNSAAEIQDNVIINSGAIIEHEAIIRKNVHIAPNATILGNVIIGKNSFIGSGSVIKQRVVIKDNAFINANTFIEN